MYRCKRFYNWTKLAYASARIAFLSSSLSLIQTQHSTLYALQTKKDDEEEIYSHIKSLNVVMLFVF